MNPVSKKILIAVSGLCNVEPRKANKKFDTVFHKIINIVDLLLHFASPMNHIKRFDLLLC